MGYRSEVKVVFYTYNKKKLPLLKLWLAENWDETPTEKYGLQYSKTRISSDPPSPVSLEYAFWGYLYEFDSIKWYDSYPEIERFINAFRSFDALCNEDNKFAAEFSRAGEDVADVEELSAGDVYGCLSTFVVIEAEITRESEDE